MPVPLVLRDLVAAALHKQGAPVTATQLVDVVAPFGYRDGRQVRKALQQLEAQGLAVRQNGRGAPPGGGRAPNWWTAASGAHASRREEAP